MATLYLFVLFGLLKQVVNGQSSYCQISGSHTLCQFTVSSVLIKTVSEFYIFQSSQGVSKACNKVVSSGFSSQEKNQVLNLHNKLRSRVSTGNERRGSPGPQPEAANMLELTWDDELAHIAQRWAEQCSFGHDQTRNVRRFQVGQNVYQTTRSRDQPVSALIREGVTSWYDEVKQFANAGVSRYNFNFGTGHYTQMLWAKTSKVGCGHVSYQSGNFINKFLVCNYGEAGNFQDSKMYKSGKACSRCPRGTRCSNRNPGLCAGEDKLSPL
jgi:hypothetical protein